MRLELLSSALHFKIMFMQKLLKINCQLDYITHGSADYLFNIHVANHPWQEIKSEAFTITPYSQVTYGSNHAGDNRLAKVQSNSDTFNVNYQALVEVNYPLPTGQEVEMDIAALPIEIIPYIWSSRYCESNALSDLTNRTFGQIPKGFQRVQAICDWIYQNITYEVGQTVSTTSTLNVLVNRVGVCRDFAHLGITFCRALNIPARFVTGYTWYEEAPTDFHAIFEAYLGGRWILFDPTHLAPVTDFARIATGLDAADTAFSTIFGNVEMVGIDTAVFVQN